MSNCFIVCLLAFALVGMLVFKHLNGYSRQKFIRFNNSLNQEQQLVYGEIKRERKNIFIVSTLIALVVSLYSVYYLYQDKTRKTKPKYLICFGLSLFIFIMYLTYTLIPKSKYMLEHLDDQTQVGLWLDIYKSYRNANQYGLLFGILVFYIFYHFKKIRN